MPIARIITFTLETAMRRGEITAMQWGHLDRQARVLLIPKTKTGTPRWIPLSSRALASLPVLPSPPPRSLIWGQLHASSLSHTFLKVCRRAEIEDLRFHDLRHEAVSRLFERGLNPLEVAAISGHKSMQMLKRYTHLRAEDLVKKLG